MDPNNNKNNHLVISHNIHEGGDQRWSILRMTQKLSGKNIRTIVGSREKSSESSSKDIFPIDKINIKNKGADDEPHDGEVNYSGGGLASSRYS